MRAFPPEELPWDELAFESTRAALRDYLNRFFPRVRVVAAGVTRDMRPPALESARTPGRAGPRRRGSGHARRDPRRASPSTRARCRCWARSCCRSASAERALALLRRAAAAAPRSAEARNLLARALHALGRDEEALAAARARASRCWPIRRNFLQAAPVYLTLVWCLRELRRSARRWRRPRKGLRRTPDAVLAEWATVVEQELAARREGALLTWTATASPTRSEVRFRDLDALGHVNNAVYLTYFEAARMAYWMHVNGRADLRRWT